MNERITSLKKLILEKKHHIYRREIDKDVLKKVEDKIRIKDMSYTERVSKRLQLFLQLEKPIVLKEEKITYMRTIINFPDIYTDDEWVIIKKNHFIHEKGKVCNISSDYQTTLSTGLEEQKKFAINSIKDYKTKGDIESIEFLESVIKLIESVEMFADQYAEEARRVGNYEVAKILSNVPRYGAKTFHEALQFFRILHFTLWCEGNYHNTIGRFDQYMYPYLKSDLQNGRLDENSAFELLEEFFLSFNRDSDLYPGMQQGDNGQSLVLGGIDESGNEGYNKLSEMCLKASLELKLIDPKINLRVNSKTPLEIYKLGTELTKQGLGFPQYSNDDVVIPGLVDKGYDLKDANNYVVAACWEFIIPGLGMDIPNISALSFAKVIEKCIETKLMQCNDFSDFMVQVRKEIFCEIDNLTTILNNIYIEPAPFQSILMDGCIRTGRDVSKGLKYNNYGIHGTGLSNAVDSLAAVKKYVFKDKTISANELIDALKNNFVGYDKLRSILKYDAPKLGNNEDFVDSILCELLDIFAETLKDKVNERGGCYRAGTGSAMYYVWHGQELGATADGRREGEALSANYSPSPNIRVKGPVSVIKSFIKPNLKKVINGGPLTMEMHDSVFRTSESTEKVAALIKSFIDYGGHQLQINTLNKETLLEAQKNPAGYQNLIVRVWGWSGYFIELDKVYQDHIINRIEFSL